MVLATSATDKDALIQISIRPGAYELESLGKEIKRIVVEGHFDEADYPFTTKPNSSPLGSIIEIFIRKPLFSFIPDERIRYLLGFNPGTTHEKYNLSLNPVDILSFDNIFFETDMAQRRIFEGKRTKIVHNSTLDVNHSYN